MPANHLILGRGPLFRIRLFQLEDEEHVLHFNMHHIISDGWSFGVMRGRLQRFTPLLSKAKPADLPELPVQYADYALWQRQWLQGEALETQLNYWQDKLGGELPVLELPTRPASSCRPDPSGCSRIVSFVKGADRRTAGDEAAARG